MEHIRPVCAEQAWLTVIRDLLSDFMIKRALETLPGPIF